jgi:glycosyltransferase involved in cell wall biosynthesis
MVKLAEVCLSRSFGETEKSAVGWVENLDRRGHEVFIIVPEGSRLSQAARDRGLNQITVPLLSRRFALRAALKIRSFLSRHGIEIVQSHYPGDLWTLYAALLGRAPRLVSVWNELPEGVSRRTAFHGFLHKRISGVIVPTAIGKRLVVASTKVPGEKVAVIPKGFDVKAYDLGPGVRDRARRELEVGEDIVVGTVGAIAREKGQFELLEAVRLVLRHFTNIRLVIAGDASSAEGQGLLRLLKERAHKYHMDEVVIFTDGSDNLPRLLRALDIFVMPALEENFSDHLAQAMLTGLACVGTDAGGTPELLDDGKAGLLVPPGSADGLSRAISTLMENPDLPQILGRRARESARERFDLDKVMDQAEEFYSLAGVL